VVELVIDDEHARHAVMGWLRNAEIIVRFHAPGDRSKRRTAYATRLSVRWPVPLGSA
jgi:hypothetical protein